MIDILVIAILLISLPLSYYLGLRKGNKIASPVFKEKRLEEYDFYPFITNEDNFVEFSQELFNKAVLFFNKNKNDFASKQLIIVGEQNIVQEVLHTDDLNQYLELYKKYDGNSLLSENDKFMENYKRIVILMGKSFKGTGLEILLHNLVNPTKSVIAIENGEVTGRKIENGTTKLLLDLKTRKLQNQDKLNYELKIGSRLFKCTTIPIFRRDFGLVGAICINVDVNFIKEAVLDEKEKLDAFIQNIVKTDFELEENILSKEEFSLALEGKKHFADDILRRSSTTSRNSRLMAILFSDIVNYTSLMNKDEGQAIKIVDRNKEIHQSCIVEFNGTLLKEMGDGVLASFASVSDAVNCGIQIQQNIISTENFLLRLGIHLGEINTSSEDVLGDGVNIASRIEATANPSTVTISETVFENIKNKVNHKIKDVGEKKLKNIDRPIKLYEIEIS